MAVKYKYNKARDFRKEKPKLVRTDRGWQWIQGCDELISGRWEGFVAFKTRVFKTKAEAMKHKPKWTGR